MDRFLVDVSEMFISPAAWPGSAQELLNHGTRGSLATPGNTNQPMGNEAEQGQGNTVPPPGPLSQGSMAGGETPTWTHDRTWPTDRNLRKQLLLKYFSSELGRAW